MNQVSDPRKLKVVGTRPIRPDGADKVTGRAGFGADMSLPGMLTGAIKRSPHAHARIRSIDTSKAAALPGRSEEHTSELQSLMRISYAVFCLTKKTKNTQ